MEMTNEERNAEIAKHMGYIGEVARRKLSLAKSNGYEYRDLVNAGVTGLVHALEKFDPNHESGANVLTYAKYWIRQKITNTARERCKVAKQTVSLDNQINMNGDVVTVMDIITKETSESTAGQGIDYAYLREVIESDLLLPIEQVVIRMKYFEDAKHREIDAVIQKQFRDKAKAFFYLKTAQKKLRKFLQDKMR